MDLDLTVAFMEARETGKRDLVLLNGGPTDSLQSLQIQVPEVQPGRPLLQVLQEDAQQEDQGGAGQGQHRVSHAQHCEDRRERPLPVQGVRQGNLVQAGHQEAVGDENKCNVAK